MRNRKKERLHEETGEETSYVTNDRKKTGQQQVEDGGSGDLLKALHYEQLKQMKTWLNNTSFLSRENNHHLCDS